MRDKNVLWVISTQWWDMTALQSNSKLESTYSLVILFVLAIALLKKRFLNRYVSAVIYHCTLTGSVSVISFLFTFAFKMTVNDELQQLPAAISTEVVPAI